MSQSTSAQQPSKEQSKWLDGGRQESGNLHAAESGGPRIVPNSSVHVATSLESSRIQADPCGHGSCTAPALAAMDSITDDDALFVRSLTERFMSNPAGDDDIRLVQRQLGRYPRGMVSVGARCAVCGAPFVVVTRPMLTDGTPFPTTCYLTSPEAVKAVSHVEAAGRMAQFNELLAQDERVKSGYVRAHRMYLAFRSELAGRLGDDERHIAGISAGGMPTRVKCLHALVAQSLVMGNGINPIGDMTLELISDEFQPGVCRCSIHEAQSR